MEPQFKIKTINLLLDDYRALVQRVYERDRWKCTKCGRVTSLTPHHKKKRSQGGGDTMENIVTLCVDCHRDTDEYGPQLRAKKASGIQG